MRTQQLSYFVAVATTGHFTTAAGQCGVSQPTLSKQIRSLENSLGTRLFRRLPTGVELTTAGQALLPHARRILVEVDNAERSVREVAELRRGRVRVGATPSTIEGLLADVLAGFSRSHPRIEIELREGGSRMLTRDLVEGRLDLALLIGPLRDPVQDLQTTTVYRERLVLAAPASARLPAAVTVADLRTMPLVMFRDGYDLREVTLRACAAEGFEPHLAVEGAEMGSVLRLVECGLGFAVVPEIVMRNRAGLRHAPIASPPLTREIAVAHREVASLPLAARAFRDHLVEELANAR